MSGAVGASRLLDERRSAEYDAWAYERLKTDEVTQASEQLNGAMENTFEYRLDGDELYFQGEALTPIFDRGTATAQRLMMHKPDFIVEYIRRLIERRQLSEQINLRKNVDWNDPDILIHISPTPDAVLDGTVNVNAYDTQRKKIMVRITEPTSEGVRVTSISLDGNDRAALQSVGDFIGIDIPNSATSEDILAMRGLVRKSRFEGRKPSDVIRGRYDDAMTMHYGGQWYAGRQDNDVIHTIDRINAERRIIDEHMRVVMDLKRQYGASFRDTERYKRANRNFLAAIHYASEHDGFAGSLSDAGGMADHDGLEFAKPDCPTDVSAEEALAEQGIGDKKEMKCVTCPFCHRIVDAKIDGGTISCPECFKAVDKKGKVFDMKKPPATTEPEQTHPPMSFPKLTLQQLAERAFTGVNVRVRFVLGFGGGDHVVYDRETGTTLATINDGNLEPIAALPKAA